jgi:hypothetical protein
MADGRMMSAVWWQPPLKRASGCGVTVLGKLHLLTPVLALKSDVSNQGDA